MTVSSTTNRNTYTGNDTTATYNYGFRIFQQGDLLVTVKNTTTDVETTLAITTDYTVVGVGEAAGGTIVLVDASQAWMSASSFLDTDYILSVRRVVNLTQITDIRNQGDFYPEVHEDEFDKSRMIDQQQQDEIDRSIKLPESLDPTTFNAALPDPVADYFVKINNTADGLELSEASIDNIVDSNIHPDADITRTKLAPGTADHVMINDVSGEVSSEAALAKSRGGTGADNSSVTFPTTGTVITEDSTSTITNKTIDADGTGNSITNIEDENIKAGAAIDASKLADGSVSNTELQYINSLTSNAQTQLGTKVDTGTANEVDVTGTTVSLADNPVVPGTDSMRIPTGATADRVSTTDGAIRFNTTLNRYEGHKSSSWNELGGGAGGGLDVFSTEDFEVTQASELSSDSDATFLGTSGTFGGTLADETSSQFAGTRSIKWTGNATAGNNTNDWVALDDITLEDKQKGQDCGITFYYSWTGTSGNMKAVVYDVTNSRELTSTALDTLDAASSATRFSTSFFIPLSCNSIRVGFHCTTGEVSKVLIFDDIELTQNPFVYKNLTKKVHVRAEGNGATSVTAGSTNIDFTEVDDPEGAWDGDTYTVQQDNSTIILNGNIAYTGAANWYTAIYVNGVNKRYYIDNGPTSSARRFTFVLAPGDVSKGDMISLRPINASGVLSNDPPYHWIRIIEEWETEHVVTPAKASTEMIGYNGYISGHSSGIRLRNELSNTGSQLIEVDNTTFTLVTVLKECYINVTANANDNSFDYFSLVAKDIGGTTIVAGYSDIVSSLQYGTGLCLSFKASIGDYIYMSADATIGTYDDEGMNLTVTATPLEAQFLAAVPVQKVAYIRPAAYPTYTVAAAGTTSFKTIPLVSVGGDSEIVSIDTGTDRFTLGPGKYFISPTVASWSGSQWIEPQLYNVDTASVEYLYGEVAFSVSGAISFNQPRTTIEIATSTVFEMQARSSAAAGTEYYGPIEIVKIK